MTHLHPSHSGSPFANRDLRNRSFQGQMLHGANFSGSDIRGCDFSNAQLSHANFQQVKAGLTRRQQWIHGAMAMITLLFMANIVSQLVISSLGQTIDDRAWRFVVALYVVLALAGWGAAIQFWAGRFRGRHWAGVGSGILSAALVGFFYAGSSSDNNATVATLGALAAGCFAAWMQFRSRQRNSGLNIATAAAATVCAYGFNFWVGSIAIALLSVQRFAWGSLISLLTLLCLWLTLAACRLLMQQIQQAVGTCFRGADLTYAQFDAASLPNTDFSRSIGYEISQ